MKFGSVLAFLLVLAFASSAFGLFQASHFEAIFKKYGCRQLHCYSIEGLGNNEKHKDWGSANSNFREEFHKAYLDHFEVPFFASQQRLTSDSKSFPYFSANHQ